MTQPLDAARPSCSQDVFWLSESNEIFRESPKQFCVLNVESLGRSRRYSKNSNLRRCHFKDTEISFRQIKFCSCSSFIRTTDPIDHQEIYLQPSVLGIRNFLDMELLQPACQRNLQCGLRHTGMEPFDSWMQLNLSQVASFAASIFAFWISVNSGFQRPKWQQKRKVWPASNFRTLNLLNLLMKNPLTVCCLLFLVFEQPASMGRRNEKYTKFTCAIYFLACFFFFKNGLKDRVRRSKILRYLMHVTLLLFAMNVLDDIAGSIVAAKLGFWSIVETLMSRLPRRKQVERESNYKCSFYRMCDHFR